MSDEIRRRMVLQSRIIWAALLVGQLAFLAVIAYLLESGELRIPAEPLGLYEPLAWAAGIGLPLTGIALRAVLLRTAEAVTPGWLRANVVSWAMCEGAVLLCLVLCLITGRWTPYVYPAILGFFTQLVLFPRTPGD